MDRLSTVMEGASSKSVTVPRFFFRVFFSILYFLLIYLFIDIIEFHYHYHTILVDKYRFND